MEEGNLKSIKITLNSATPEGKYIPADFTINVGKPKWDKRYMIGYTKESYAKVFILSFTMKIPDFIHEAIKGQSIGCKALNDMRDSDRKYASDLPKTISSETLEGLTTKFHQIVSDYIWLKRIEKRELTKVIFYEFKGNVEDTRSTWNGTKVGKSADINYHYFIGYLADDSRYNGEKKLFNTHYDQTIYRMKFVKWTLEREAFFVNLEKGFESLINKISDFESNLSEDTINSLLSNTKLLE